MKTFNNDKNRIEAERGVSRMAKGLFWVSVFSSALCVVGIALEFVRTDAPAVHDYFFTGDTAFMSKAVVFALAMYVLHFIEFFGVALAAKMVFTEAGGFAAAQSGLVAKYNGMRQASLILWGCVFMVAASFSGATSYYGSKAIGAIAASRIDTDKVSNLPKERQKAVTQATETQAAKVEALKAEQAAAIAKAELGIAGETKRLAKRNNEWAKNEISAATAAAANPYASKITKAEAELAAAQKDANSRYDKVENTMLKATESDIVSAQEKGKTVGLLTTLLGILPMVLGIAIVGITSMSEVAAKVPSTKDEADVESGAASLAGSACANRSRNF